MSLPNTHRLLPTPAYPGIMQDPSLDTASGGFEKPYVGVKLAPTITKLKVIAVERRAEDGHLWYTLQIHPAPVSLPAATPESAKNTDKPLPVRLSIKKKPYTVYRRHADVVEFTRRLQAAFQSRRPVVLIELPPLAPTCELDDDMYECDDPMLAVALAEQALMEQVDAVVQKVARLPGALMQDKVIREFFGIWKSDVDYKLTRNLSDPIALTTAQRAVVLDDAEVAAMHGSKLTRTGTLPLSGRLHSGEDVKHDKSPVPAPSSITFDIPQQMLVYPPGRELKKKGDVKPQNGRHGTTDAKRTLSFGNFKPIMRRATTKLFGSHMKRTEPDVDKHAGFISMTDTRTDHAKVPKELIPAISTYSRFPVVAPRHQRSGSLNGGSSGSEMSGLEIVDTGFLDEEGCPMWLRHAVESLEVTRQVEYVEGYHEDGGHLPAGRTLRKQKTAPALSIHSSRTSNSGLQSSTSGNDQEAADGINEVFTGSRHTRAGSEASVLNVSGYSNNDSEANLSSFFPPITGRSMPTLRSRSRSQQQLRSTAGPSPLSSTFSIAEDTIPFVCTQMETITENEAAIKALTLPSAPTTIVPPENTYTAEEKSLIRKTSLAKLRQRLERKGSSGSNAAVQSDLTQAAQPYPLPGTTTPPSMENSDVLLPATVMQATVPSGMSSTVTSPPTSSGPLNLIPNQLTRDSSPTPPLPTEPVIDRKKSHPTLARRPSVGHALNRKDSIKKTADVDTILQHVEAIDPGPSEATLTRTASIKQQKTLKHKPVSSFSATNAMSATSGSDSDAPGATKSELLEIKVVMDKNALIKVNVSREIEFDDLITRVRMKFERCGYDVEELVGRGLVYRDAERNVVKIDGDFSLRVVMMAVAAESKLTLFFV